MEYIITFWFVIGVLLLLSEFLIPGFTIFFFGLGAILTSAIILIIPPLRDQTAVQIIIFTVVSIISLIFLRRRFKMALKGELFKERDDYTDQECIVTESVSVNKPGRVKFHGTTWIAETMEGKLSKNKKVLIVGKKENYPMIFIIKEIK
ncbi:MAG: NfeD family protein [Spirochaetaceae bacterium]